MGAGATRSPLASHQSAPAAVPVGSGGNSHDVAINIGDVLTEGGNPVRNYGPDQSRSVRTRRSRLTVEIDEFAKVTLASGRVVLLDAADVGVATTHYLYFHYHAATPYVQAICKETKRGQRLAKILCAPKPGFVVDHINGDGLDNRRSNLRVVTSQQNNRNRAKMRGTISRFKGVSKSRNRWIAYLYVNYRQIHLGMFSCEMYAAHAYDAAARQMFGSCAALNFPLPGEQSAHRRDSIVNFHRSIYGD